MSACIPGALSGSPAAASPVLIAAISSRCGPVTAPTVRPSSDTPAAVRDVAARKLAGAMIDDWTPLDRDFFDRPVLEVAPDLLGTVLWHDAGPDGLVAVRLTEVEAYGGADDPGSHGYRGRTPRNSVMFGAPRLLYVYFPYRLHWGANAVTGT